PAPALVAAGGGGIALRAPVQVRDDGAEARSRARRGDRGGARGAGCVEGLLALRRLPDPPRHQAEARRRSRGPRCAYRRVGMGRVVRWWGGGEDRDAISLPAAATDLLREELGLTGDGRGDRVALEQVAL